MHDSSNSILIEEASLLEFAKTAELEATRVLEGLHHSKRGGEGVEFHSALPYTEGDDLRRLDWKRYASTDRLYVRKFEKEEKVGWTILLDGSGSMKYGQKLATSRLLAASLIFLADAWGDSWLLLPSTQYSVEEAFRELKKNSVGLSPREFLKVQGQSDNRLVVLSDFFFDQNGFEKEMKVWRDEFKSVHLLQVLDSKERNFDFESVTQFEDMESTHKLILDAKIIKKTYLEKLNDNQKFLQKVTRDSGSFQSFDADPSRVHVNLIGFFEDLWQL